MHDVTKAVGIAFRGAGETILLIGETKGHIGQSLYLREIFGREEGAPPPVDLLVERKHGEYVRSLIEARLVTACHDVSDGGLLVALTEMAMASGIGILFEQGGDAGYWFGEDQGRYVIATNAPEEVLAKAKAAGIPIFRLGRTGGVALAMSEGTGIAIETLTSLHEKWLPSFMQ